MTNVSTLDPTVEDLQLARTHENSLGWVAAWFRDLSIPTKLITLTALTLTLALVALSTALVYFQLRASRQAKLIQLTTLMEVLAANSTAAINFGQHDALAELLDSLDQCPTINQATVFDVDEVPLATRSFNKYETGSPAAPQRTLDHAAGREVLLTTAGREAIYLQPIDTNTILLQISIWDMDEIIGYLVVEDSSQDLTANKHLSLQVTMFAIVASLGIGIGAALPLLRSISDPLLRLSKATQEISNRMDFSIRVYHRSQDEIGVLYREFNTMLLRLHHSTQETKEAREELERLNEDLEDRVRQRTEQVEKANQSLQDRVAEIRQANEKLKATQAEVIEVSRRAGMADIATGVLHNIGNVLNSVNVSVSMINGTAKGLAVARLERCAELIQSNDHDLVAFFGQSSKGKLVPKFLSSLATQMKSSQEQILSEAKSLAEHVEHIKDVVRSQQSNASAAGMIEKCEAVDLFENALRFVSDSIRHHRIDLVREFSPVQSLQVDKSRMIQVLVNLIKNAKEAIMMNAESALRLTLVIESVADSQVRFKVRDTGIGIDADTKKRLFTQGFTTKKEGHGFGLHTSANMIKELGGQLSVHSEGLGQGATFVIDLPCQPPSRNHRYSLMNADADSDADGVEVPVSTGVNAEVTEDALRGDGPAMAYP